MNRDKKIILFIGAIALILAWTSIYGIHNDWW